MENNRFKFAGGSEKLLEISSTVQGSTSTPKATKKPISKATKERLARNLRIAEASDRWRYQFFQSQAETIATKKECELLTTQYNSEIELLKTLVGDKELKIAKLEKELEELKAADTVKKMEDLELEAGEEMKKEENGELV